ncbi:MAG: FAD:protein FMN transferase [Gammaproteobacteria bacterium]|nr:FAD:protein FMN transferase [Gammaproteobacteria bacterium]MDH5239958.1 FAD:protein FMN transferase [Gammaproteobacteria bacterium]MDH5260801.1 FAD:protein FMN transferase [Gammaproteobacteria bacterium]MDH5583826.1 FAD:protein FMN transferase [Gammaproteobacteria bacterium]
MQARLALLVSFVAIGACGDPLLPSYDLSGNTMGTTFNITLVAPPADADLDALREQVYKTLENIEDIASTYREDSELSRFNRNPSIDWIDVTHEFCDMVDAAIAVNKATHGAFDVTVGPLVNLWGFGPGDGEDRIPTDEEIAAALSFVGANQVEADCRQPALIKTSPDVYVDLSGWAKGYAVDEIATLLDRRKLTNYLVEIGGELRVRGHNAEQGKFAVAIEKPNKNNKMEYSILRVTDTAVATSGDYRNYFENDGRRYSHMIDPRTGRPIDHELTGVTVVSKTTAFADAMATALMVLGPQDGPALAEERDLAAYFLVRTDSGIIEKSTSRFEELKQE